MRPKRSTLISASLITFTMSAVMSAGSMSPGVGFPQPARAGQLLTGKERLSDKGSDERRVDNCRVPRERRGVKARPDCPGSPPSSLLASGRK